MKLAASLGHAEANFDVYECYSASGQGFDANPVFKCPMFNANKWFEPIDSLAVDPDKARHQLVEAARLGYDYAKNIIVMKKQNAQQFQLRPDLSFYKFDAAMFSNPDSRELCFPVFGDFVPAKIVDGRVVEDVEGRKREQERAAVANSSLSPYCKQKMEEMEACRAANNCSKPVKSISK